MAHNNYTVEKLMVKAGVPKAMNALHQLFELMALGEAAINTESLNNVVYFNLAEALNKFKGIVVEELRRNDVPESL